MNSARAPGAGTESTIGVGDVAGRDRVDQMPWRPCEYAMSTVMAISRPAPDALPGVGEHTVEILAELGVTAAETDALLAA